MRRGERGAAGLLITVGMMLSTLAVFTVAAVFIAWFSAARQAEQAAELAALAAVASAVHGDAPCVAAETTAQMNGVSLQGCQVRGGAAMLWWRSPSRPRWSLRCPEPPPSSAARRPQAQAQLSLETHPHAAVGATNRLGA